MDERRATKVLLTL